MSIPSLDSASPLPGPPDLPFFLPPFFDPCFDWLLASSALLSEREIDEPLAMFYGVLFAPGSLFELKAATLIGLEFLSIIYFISIKA